MSAFQSLDLFREDARRVAPVLHPLAPLAKVVFVFADGFKTSISCPVTAANFATGGTIEAQANDMPTLSAVQKRILVSLRDDGPAGGDSLATRLGYSSSTSLHPKNKRGIKQLQEMGLVINDEETGYELTAFGQDVADRLGE